MAQHFMFVNVASSMAEDIPAIAEIYLTGQEGTESVLLIAQILYR
jgi:hypothetical protein